MNIDTTKSGWIGWTKDFKRKKLTETLELTLSLFKEGKTVKQIAKKREFKEDSVERHIVELITKTFISVEDIIPQKKVDAIIDSASRLGVKSLTNLKEDLGDKYSWFEIKCVLAHLSSMPEKR